MTLDVSIDAIAATGVSPDLAKTIRATLDSAPVSPAPETWRYVTDNVLGPELPFSLHQLLFQVVYGDWDHSQGPPPAWSPSPDDISRSNIQAFCDRAGVESPDRLHAWSAGNRADFWRHMIDALGVRFRTPPRSVLDPTGGVEVPRWLDGATLNIAESCFQAEGDAPAIVCQAEGGSLQSLSYDALDRLSNRFANSLDRAGFSAGDAIAIAMPMNVESVVAYLGIVKAGCVVVSIADSFAADEIATRLRIAGASAIVTQDVIHRSGKTLPMYEKVIAAGAGSAIVVSAGDALAVSLRGGDSAWSDFLVGDDVFAAVPRRPDDASNVLFSSGTTGEPKAIPWTQATPLKCAADGYLHHDIAPGDVVAWPTNLGWMMGPWLIYASLVNRGTMALFYDPPGTAAFCRFVQDARVNMLGLVPSIVKAWRSSGAAAGVDWQSIKVFSSTGEASNADDYLYLMSLAHYRPVIEYCGGTEIGGGYVCGAVTQPASPATFSTPAFGLDFHILNDDGEPDRTGEVFLVPPSIGLSETLLNKDHHDVYYAGTPDGPNGETLRRHGDEMERLGGGYYRAQGRADDTMNLSGIKVSAAEIERTVATVEGVVETAAIAVAERGGGPSRLVIYVVPQPGADADTDALAKTMQKAIAGGLNPLFRIHDVVVIDALPRTASNKVMRRVLRDRYAGGGD